MLIDRIKAILLKYHLKKAWLQLALFLPRKAQTQVRRKTLSHNRNTDGHIQPLFTTLAPVKQEILAESPALKAFLAQRPEFASSQEHMEFLRYCFTHYVNIDPELRDLSIFEKLTRAGDMAKDFLGVISPA
jgi:hypothetical protein